MNSEFFYELNELCRKHNLDLDKESITQEQDGAGFFLTDRESGRRCGSKPTQSIWNFKIIEYNR